MAASTGDKITDVRNAARPVTTTVSSGRSAGGTSLACSSLTGWPTASKIHFVTYKIDSNSDPVAGTQLDCQGIVSGNTINSFSVIDGSDTGNSVGDVVEMLPTAAWGQDLADALTSQHSRTGAHVGVTNTSGMTNAGGLTNTGGATMDSLTVSGATTHTGATTLTGAVGGTGYDAKTIANSYKFSVYRSSAWTTSNAYPGTTVTLYDTKVFDTGSNIDVVTNKGRFTAPIAGFYFFTAAGGASGLAGGSGFGINFIKNGVAISTGQVVWIQGATGAFSAIPSSSAFLQLAANDYIEVNTYASGSAGTTGTSTCFMGFLVSAS